MNSPIQKQDFEELMKLPGELMGNGPKTIGEFILKKEGENGLLSLEKAMADFGYTIKFKEIDPMKRYPFGLVAVSLTLINQIFHYSEKDFRDIGRTDVKFSPLTKIFFRFFVSVESTARGASKIWNKYHTVGSLNIVEFNKEKKYVILRVENFHLVIFHCYYIAGYMCEIIKMVTGKDALCEETKCVHRGDSYNEFLLKW
jgi:hypothetical protein